MTNTIELDQQLLKNFIPFHSLSATHLTELLRGVRQQNAVRGTILFKCTDSVKQSFYVLSGSVDLRDKDGKKITTIVSDSSAARYALHSHSQYPATAVVANNATLMIIDKNYLDLVLTWDQAGEYVVSELSGTKKEKTEEADWMSSLLESPLFAQIPAANIQKLFAKFESIHVNNGDAVIKEGDPGDYFYVLSQGSAKVVRHLGAANQEVLAELSPGSFFGEEALISDAPRNASIVMTSGGVLKRLKKNDFSDLLHKPLLNYLDQAQLEGVQKNPNYKTMVLDVRLAVEYEFGHVEGSTNIPLPMLRKQLSTLDPNTIYVTTCDGGRRCEVATHMLSQAGLNAYILKI